MRIHLPNSAFLGNIDPVLKRFDPSAPDKLTITANEHWISIHPIVVAMIGALGHGMERENIEWQNRTAKSFHYLQRIGLTKHIPTKAQDDITEHEPAGRFIPLTNIRDAEGQTRFINDMIPLLHLDYEQAEPIKYVISELLRNVLEHAHTAAGAWVCAQYYPKTKRVGIGIADTGIGLKASLERTHPITTDLEAIRYALMPGVSGSAEQDLNAGAGLFFTKTIAKANKDFFVTYTGNASYKLLKPDSKTRRPRYYADPFKDRHNTNEGLPYWQGTVIGIDISTDNTTAFSELMQEMRELYTEKLKEKKEIIKVRPKFT